MRISRRTSSGFVANSSEPHVKALLCSSLASQALNKGDEPTAISNLRQEIVIYDQMPESPATLNNSSTALMTLATLTGDSAAYERAGTLIARAAALEPGNSLTLTNAASALLEAGMRDVVANQIDLKMIKSSAGVDLLNFLVKDESQREDMSARLRAHSVVNRALSLMEKVILLAPRNSSSYEAGIGLLVSREDLEGLRRIRSKLQGITLDLDDDNKRAREAYAGKKDKEMQGYVKASLAKLEPILPVARAKGGPTFAALVSHVVRSRMQAPHLGSRSTATPRSFSLKKPLPAPRHWRAGGTCSTRCCFVPSTGWPGPTPVSPHCATGLSARCQARS